jgi:hypothetical protein
MLCIQVLLDRGFQGVMPGLTTPLFVFTKGVSWKKKEQEEVREGRWREEREESKVEEGRFPITNTHTFSKKPWVYKFDIKKRKKENNKK